MSQMARSHALPASSVPISCEQPERARGLARDAGQAFRRRSGGTASPPCSWPAAARSAATCRDCSRSRSPSARRAARSSSIGGSLRLADEVVGAGQQHGDRAGRGHRRHAGLVGIFEMIGRQRAEARGERRAVQVGELVGVQLHRQAEARPPRRTRARSAPARTRCLRRSASTASARPGRGDRRQHLVADAVDIGVARCAHLGRQRMRAEEGGDDARPRAARRARGRRAAASARRRGSSP